jgi:hypothetical protein
VAFPHGCSYRPRLVLRDRALEEARGTPISSNTSVPLVYHCFR